MLTIVIGGSGSGKSEYAESLVQAQSKAYARYYVATMHVYDDESRRRVNRHRDMRKDKGFITVEQELNINNLTADKNGIYLLEDLSNLLANELYIGCKSDQERDAFEERYEGKIVEPLIELSKNVKHLVIVTNDVFRDGRKYHAETMRFNKILGEINCKLTTDAQNMVEVVCGIPLWIKGNNELE